MNLIRESSPHFATSNSTQRIMALVALSLVPTLIASVVLFGLGSAILTLFCVAVCLASEHLCCVAMKRESSADDFSAVVTGMLLAFTLPVSTPYWVAGVGSLFAIVVVKMLFGGIGKNIANPAVAARVFIMLAFPAAISTYPQILGASLDAISTATPLAASAAGTSTYGYMQLFLGQHPGAIGETCALTLLIGYVFLLIMGVVDGWATLPFIGTVAVISFFAGQDVVAQLLSGGLALGAFFMATDYTTTPMTKKGKVIFGLGCGLITSLIRFYGGYPEGVAMSILFMNMLTPVIDRICLPTPEGGVKYAFINR